MKDGDKRRDKRCRQVGRQNLPYEILKDSSMVLISRPIGHWLVLKSKVRKSIIHIVQSLIVIFGSFLLENFLFYPSKKNKFFVSLIFKNSQNLIGSQFFFFVSNHFFLNSIQNNWSRSFLGIFRSLSSLFWIHSFRESKILAKFSLTKFQETKNFIEWNPRVYKQKKNSTDLRQARNSLDTQNE